MTRTETPTSVSQLSAVLGLIALIAGGVIYVTNIKTNVAVQEKQVEVNTKDISELKFDNRYMVRLVEKISEKNNIDIERTKLEVEQRLSREKSE